MGKAKAPKQSAQAGGVALPPTDEQALAPLQTPPARGAAPCDDLSTLDGQQSVRADLVLELQGGVTDVRAKAISVAFKGINDYERAELRREEDDLDSRVAAELGQIKRNKERMRSGVVPEDEAPELPLAGSPRTH